MLNFSAAWLFDGAFVLIMAVSIFLAAKLGAFKAVSGIAVQWQASLPVCCFRNKFPRPLRNF
jgi:hypothetical protein